MACSRVGVTGKLTVDHSKVDSDCSDFPVKAILDGDNFDFSKARPDGYDIRFTGADRRLSAET